MQFSDETRPVKIDHLAFSFPYSSLKHLDKSNDKEFLMMQMPVMKHSSYAASTESIGRTITDFNNKTRKVLSDRFNLFMDKVFGFRLSPFRGRGLHGYEDSMVILDRTGTVPCGLVGFGGNRDTIFVQINGTGCTKLFEYTSHQEIHKWLTFYLGVSRLSRLDLAVDDFTGGFDCKYAEKAFYNDAFRTSARGRSPSMVPHKRVTRTGELLEEATLIGSRTSLVYWRVYNKKLEQKITDKDVIWYRNEVELKKCDIDMLARPASAFAGLCDFSASIEPAEPVKFASKKKVVGLEFFGRIAWARRQCGKALAEIVAMTDGDLGESFGMLIPEKYRRANFNELGVPDSYQHIKSFIYSTN